MAELHRKKFRNRKPDVFGITILQAQRAFSTTNEMIEQRDSVLKPSNWNKLLLNPRRCSEINTFLFNTGRIRYLTAETYIDKQFLFQL